MELINVSKEEDPRVAYPSVIRKEGIAPSQYGTRSLMGDNKLTEVEEKYDLSALGAMADGFGKEGEDDNGSDSDTDGDGEGEDANGTGDEELL